MPATRVEHTEHCTLYLGDCLDVLPTLPKVDAVVTSPPYNCGKQYGECSDDLQIDEYWDWLENVVSKAVGTLLPHGFLCVNHGNFIGSRENRQFVPDELRPILDRHIRFRDWIIWDKGPASGAAWGNFRTSPRIRAQHENIFIHGGHVAMPPSDIDWSDWSSYTSSIWRIATSDVELSVHPAMMPVEIPRRLALLYSPACGEVIDPFMGSGTTGVACIRTGRKFIGIENDPKHFETALRRIREAERMALCNLFKETKPVERRQLELV